MYIYIKINLDADNFTYNQIDILYDISIEEEEEREL